VLSKYLRIPPIKLPAPTYKIDRIYPVTSLQKPQNFSKQVVDFI